MSAPQIIIALWLAVDVGVCFYLHGQPRKPVDATVGIPSTIILTLLLLWGGFFS